MAKSLASLLGNTTANAFISGAQDLLWLIENDWFLQTQWENRNALRKAAITELYKAIDELERLNDIDRNTQGRGY